MRFARVLFLRRTWGFRDVPDVELDLASDLERIAEIAVVNDEILGLAVIPEDLSSVTQLYDSATKFIRYLFGKYRAELFPKFVDRLLDGTFAEAALADVYGNEFRDLPAFDKRFQTSIR